MKYEIIYFGAYIDPHKGRFARDALKPNEFETQFCVYTKFDILDEGKSTFNPISSAPLFFKLPVLY